MKFLCRNICIMMVFAAAAATAGCAKQPPAVVTTGPVDGQTIVARVNGADITVTSFRKMMERIQAIEPNSSSQEPSEIRGKALDQLILEELALQEAKRLGLSVKPKDMEAAISVVAGHKTEDYEAYLAKQHITDAEFRSELVRSQLIRLVMEREIAGKIRVTADDVQKEYEHRKDRYAEPEMVAVVDVTISPKLLGAAAVKKASELAAQINADKEKNPWNLTDDGTFTVQNTDLGDKKDTALYKAARELKEGEISGAIHADGGVHVLKLSEYRPRRQMPYEEVKGRIEAMLKIEALKKRREEWERELKKGAKIEFPEGQAQKASR